jgi:hypothetical protein
MINILTCCIITFSSFSSIIDKTFLIDTFRQLLILSFLFKHKVKLLLIFTKTEVTRLILLFIFFPIVWVLCCKWTIDTPDMLLICKWLYKSNRIYFQFPFSLSILVQRGIFLFAYYHIAVNFSCHNSHYNDDDVSLFRDVLNKFFVGWIVRTKIALKLKKYKFLTSRELDMATTKWNF